MTTAKKITAAVLVWITVALLHREHPEREDFSRDEIIQRFLKEFGQTHSLNTISTHISKHCVANKKPDPQAHRMLWNTARGRYRLYRPEDPSHPERAGATRPYPGDVPVKYSSLLLWYEEEYAPAIKLLTFDSPLFKIEPVASGYTDLSANHHRHLAEIVPEHHVVKRPQ